MLISGFFVIFYNVLKYILVLFLSLVLSIILHELGHLFMGIILGFEFEFIEIFGVNIDCNRKIKYHKTINAKTSMYLKNCNHIKLKLLMYYSGGILFNILSACIIYVFRGNFGIVSFILIEIALAIVFLLSIGRYKGSDLCNIYMICSSKYRGLVLIPYYLKCNISPKEIPDDIFLDVNKFDITDRNLFLFKMRYYNYLENGEVEKAKAVFSKMEKNLKLSKYLADKCEILFYYAVIDSNYEFAESIYKALEKYILKGNYSSKERIKNM